MAAHEILEQAIPHAIQRYAVGNARHFIVRGEAAEHFRWCIRNVLNQPNDDIPIQAAFEKLGYQKFEQAWKGYTPFVLTTPE
mmetsp:Transcript_38729/g.79373  ORF Transcript_38729/g.79373 Transcript_38729/m.79373 type:complete len:82 (+) Transcript_38729:44-289(+)|eukprot:CAMPEP_0181319724 /NCGR_PEP_ID=MMETSP1101-20121128/17731_1 /TAXON_ID=46948 /ORGANISM="Rhodomonas abbreviata, Strain Caron Lab Isolate" /LENGTH=81 /DNA_ID=CAMNT_0023427357 /DNA_START=53 /DNA_END=298 /DNA_ORIENTATION=+